MNLFLDDRYSTLFISALVDSVMVQGFWACSITSRFCFKQIMNTFTWFFFRYTLLGKYILIYSSRENVNLSKDYADFAPYMHKWKSPFAYSNACLRFLSIPTSSAFLPRCLKFWNFSWVLPEGRALHLPSFVPYGVVERSILISL